MDFLPNAISEYSEAHTTPESDLLKRLNRETNLKVMQPRMLSGHLQGRFLSLLSKLIKPKRILEIGTYTGYSAICLAEGLAEGGTLETIDNNEERLEIIKRYISEAGLNDKIIPLTGDAIELIPEIKGTFDLVFIDADKSNYLNYFNLVKDRINPGGLLIADNVLWSGKVVEGLEKNDKETEAILKFNEAFHNDPGFENVLVPIRDGLLVGRRLF